MNAKLQTFTNFFVRNNQLKNYLFFFVISVFLWFLSNLSQTYKYWVNIPIDYTQIPDGILHENLPKDTLHVEIVASGYQVVKLKMQNIALQVPVKSSDLLNTKELETNNYLTTISDLIGEENTILRVMPKQISFKLNNIRKKRVKITLDISIKYRLGYKNKQKIKISPDSLWVFGLSKDIGQLNEVYTKPIELTDVVNDITGEVALILLDGIKSNLKKVSYNMPVDQFIEMQTKVTYELINVPKSVNVVLFPKNAVVKYKVYKTDYQNVGSEDIKVVLDFKKRDSVLYPVLVYKDKRIFDVQLHPDKVAFLIKNK